MQKQSNVSRVVDVRMYSMEANSFGRYEELELLGQGGMAKVYKAFDPDLQRHVALKLLRIDDPEMTVRLLKEARTQARIEHENVCKVYETGEVDGKPYIAMQYIKGKSLKELIGEATPEQKVRVMKQVAEGVHAAHRLGMIHRDLKPANVMVEQTEDGQLVPYVMDFGLAREVGAQGLTQTGVVVGTLWYMSPEQARGETRSLDRRSDVYSLGVTMYQLLTGKLPFEEESDVNFLMNLVDESQTPVLEMDKSVPVDLQTIVMKCMEKEPHRRYDSARNLAEDLQRYLDGEPVQARRAGLAYRLWKKAKKHRLVVTVGGIALLVTLALLGMWIHARREAGLRALLAQQYGQEVERIEATLRYTYMLPLHDVRKEKAMIRQQLRQIENQLQTLGKRAKGPLHYALGRGYLALHEYEIAREHLDKAWSSGNRGPDLKYALGRVMGELYLKHWKDAERIENKELREARQAEIEEQFGKPALRYLKEIGKIELVPPDYVGALIAYYEGEYEEALKKALAASTQTPWLYEANMLEANIYAAKAIDSGDRGDNAAAMKFYENANAKLLEATNKAASDATGHIVLCELKINLMTLLIYQTEISPKKTFQEALPACNNALMAEPDSAEAYVKQAGAYYVYGEYELYHGENPVETIKKSIEAGHKAVSLDPSEPAGYDSLGYAYSLQAEYDMDDGKSPLLAVDQAIRNFQGALHVDPNHVSSLAGMGNIHLFRAEYQNEAGVDPRESIRNGVPYLEKAAAIIPQSGDYYSEIGHAFTIEAEFETDHGEDPKPAILKAIENLEKAVRLNPVDASFHDYLGLAYLEKARYEVMVQRDPAGSLDKSILNLKEATEINPEIPSLFTDLSEGYLLRAEYELTKKKSPEESLRLARDSLSRSFKITQDDRWQLLNQGSLELLEAEWRIQNGKSPEEFFEKARLHLQRLIDLQPQFPETYETMGWLYLSRAEWDSHSGKSPAASIQGGLQAVEKALALDPQMANAYFIKGKLLSIHKQPSQAEEALKRAFSINKHLKHQL